MLEREQGQHQRQGQNDCRPTDLVDAADERGHLAEEIVTAGVDVPTFTVTGDADETSRPGLVGTLVYNRITRPAWFAVARGAPHLVTVDPVDTIPFTRAVVAFLLATTGDATGCRAFVGPGWALRADPTFVRTVRNGAAVSTGCPIGGAR